MINRPLFRLIESLKPKKSVKIFYVFTRFIMGIGFILSGIRKLPGIHFTHITTDHPIGAFFYGMEATGVYWNFIGVLQIILGFMIFFYRFSVIVPVLMMPISLNIFLISVGLNMRGTPIITFLMLLANILMLMWHYKHFLPILQKPQS
ncbi:MAG: hypothetical protein MRZ79_10845 [Bacteroidia bacterium]|nr:hypothetical protein [Bacteroidia bacterium]